MTTTQICHKEHFSIVPGRLVEETVVHSEHEGLRHILVATFTPVRPTSAVHRKT